MKSVNRWLRRRLFERLDTPRPGYQQHFYNNMEKLYRTIQPGDVLLVEGRSEMSRLIKAFSNSHWSHSALYVGETLAPEGASEDEQHMIIEAFSGKGVIARPLNKYKDYNIRICRPFGIRPSDLKQVIFHAVSRIGMKYDNQNIIDIALMTLQSVFKTSNRRTIKACLGNCNDYQIICSGMIAQAFQMVGYPIVPKIFPHSHPLASEKNNPYGGGIIMRHYTQISPRDFDLSPNFEVIKYNLIGVDDFDYKSLWVDQAGEFPIQVN